MEEQGVDQHAPEIQGHGQGGEVLKNKIMKIKEAILEAFPDRECVVVVLTDDLMDIKLLPRPGRKEDDIEQIIVEGAKAWKSTG
jgi:hypothetical protein